MQTEILDEILIDAIQTRPGWLDADTLCIAQLVQCSEEDLRRAMTRSGFDCWIELSARFDLYFLQPFLKSQAIGDCMLALYADRSVGWLTGGNLESWRSSAEAASVLRQRVSPAEWLKDGYAEFFGGDATGAV